MGIKRNVQYFQSGGMLPKDREFIRDSLIVGNTIDIKRRTRKGFINEKVKIIGKFTYHFLALNSRGYKDSIMYIDLFCNVGEEVEA